MDVPTKYLTNFYTALENFVVKETPILIPFGSCNVSTINRFRLESNVSFEIIPVDFEQVRNTMWGNFLIHFTIEELVFRKYKLVPVLTSPACRSLFKIY